MMGKAYPVLQEPVANTLALPAVDGKGLWYFPASVLSKAPTTPEPTQRQGVFGGLANAVPFLAPILPAPGPASQSAPSPAPSPEPTTVTTTATTTPTPELPPW